MLYSSMNPEVQFVRCCSKVPYFSIPSDGCCGPHLQADLEVNGFKILNIGNHIVLFVFDNIQDVERIL